MRRGNDERQPAGANASEVMRALIQEWLNNNKGEKK